MTSRALDAQKSAENRESFFVRLRPFHSPATLLDMELAYTLAKFSHRAQTRRERDIQGKPIRYFEHIRRVALVLIDEAQIIESDMIIASLLHDGIEDTRDLTPELIEHCFGENVVKIVKTLSKVPKEGYLERFIISRDWRAFAIKLCDRLDNLRSLSQASLEFQNKQINETRIKYIPFFEQMMPHVPITYVDGVEGVRQKILSLIV